MKISEYNLFKLISEGKITLQITEHQFSEPSAYTKEMEVPDDWVCSLKADGITPTIGKETGYLFWTKAGWIANYDKFKKKFNSQGQKSSVNFSDLESFTYDHFEKVEKRQKAKIKELEKKLEQLKDFKP